MNASEGMAGLSLWSLHAVHQAYLTHIVIVSNHRVLKEALKASGGNLTEHHTEDVSMCTLLLMEAAKKTDHEFGCSRSSAHTMTDADSDIKKMMVHLME